MIYIPDNPDYLRYENKSSFFSNAFGSSFRHAVFYDFNSEISGKTIALFFPRERLDDLFSFRSMFFWPWGDRFKFFPVER